MAAFGILVGAYLFSRGGWFSAVLCAGSVSALSLIDHLWGTDLGRALAELTLAIIR